MTSFVFDSPVGPLYTEVTAKGVRRVDLLSPERALGSRKPSPRPSAASLLDKRPKGRGGNGAPTFMGSQAEEHVEGGEREILDALATQIDEYFDGSRPDFDLPLDVDTGSDFQRRIWQTISNIPHGQVLSYAEVAIRAGFPNAFRAVGTACGANPVALVVPCHRVVASGGKLGGYGGGLEMKVWLLRHEGFVCSAVRSDATVKRGTALGV